MNPSSYSEEIAQKIGDRLIDGISLSKICTEPGMPSMRTVLRWLAKHEEFRTLYSVARQLQADLFFEEVLQIADGAAKDLVNDPTRDWRKLQADRIRMDARKWVLARMSPQKYGKKELVPLETVFTPAITFGGEPVGITISEPVRYTRVTEIDPGKLP